MTIYFLLTLAITPPIVFMLIIYWMDRNEPESINNIVISIFLGIVSIIPALIIQLSLGSLPIFNMPGLTGGFFESFFLVSPSEELSKFLLIFFFVRKKSFFNEINDGIVYFGAGAIGFALLENVFYVLGNGFGVGILRAFTSIPVHTFCGIVVGYHFGIARFIHNNKSTGIIMRGIFLAYITHATYNTLLSSDNLLILLFLPLVVVLYVLGFYILKKGRAFSLGEPRMPSPATYSSINPATSHDNYSAINPATSHDNYSAINPATSPIVIDQTVSYSTSKRKLWKIIVSRFLFVSVLIFWVLVFIGNDKTSSETGYLLLGTIILSILPFLLAVLLEISYQIKR